MLETHLILFSPLYCLVGTFLPIPAATTLILTLLNYGMTALAS